MRCHCLALLLWGALVGVPFAVAGATGSSQFALLRSLFDPSTRSQLDAQHGYSVAVSGNIAVVGVPHADVDGVWTGAANVYDATTRALLHRLSNPDPKNYAQFGAAVSIAGTRIVVGVPGDNVGLAHVYELAGASPTFPSLTLVNPSPELGGAFGQAVAMSGSRVAVAASGRAYVFDLAGATPAVPVATLTNPLPMASDLFGYSLAMDGTRVVLGAFRSDAGVVDSGIAHVYDVTSATPGMPVLTLPNPSPWSYDLFGEAVAIAGTRVAVGAAGDDATTMDAGRAYIFDLTNASPTVPVLTLNNPTPAIGDGFGRKLALSGMRLLVGVPDDSAGANASGAVHAYDLGGGSPTTPTTTLLNPAPAALDYFGYAVAIAGTRAVVGAFRDDTTGLDSGSAYLYNLAGPTPHLPIGPLTNNTPTSSDFFGHAVGVSGTRIIVGAYGDDFGGELAGRAYLFDLTNATTTGPSLTLLNPTAAFADGFGFAVGVSGTRAVVGAYGDDASGPDSGSAHVYDLTRPTPMVAAYTLANPSPAGNDYFGYAVGISATRVVVGAYGDDAGATDAGAAHVYDLAGMPVTTPVATLTNPVPALNDHFGAAVAISGSRVVIGASRGDGGGIDAGTAYVYELASATPRVPTVILTNPSPAMGDRFGGAVAIDGTRVVIGANGDDASGENSGIAYVYDLASLTPTTPVTTLINPEFVTAGDSFGVSVAISGAHVVIGASLGDGDASDSGVAYVFNLGSASPEAPIASLNAPSTVQGDVFGGSMAIDGTTIVAGASRNDSFGLDRGAVYVFGLRPTLQIIRAAMPGVGILSWTPTTGFLLQYTDSLSPTNWVNASSGATNPVTIPLTNGPRFYQLFQP